IKKREQRCLIEGDEYYIPNRADEIEKANIEQFFKIIINNREQLYDKDVLTFKQKTKQFHDRERERFFVFLITVGHKQYILFSFIDSRYIVRKRTFLNWDYLSLNKNSTIINLNNSVPVPEEVTATYDCQSEELFVHNVFQFERMLHLYDSYKEKAKSNIEDFIHGTHSVGKEGYRVNGLDKQEVKNAIMGSVRTMKRIANFERSEFYIENIERAVNMIPDEKQRVTFDHQTKEIKVSPNNVRTFVAIVHDSIVHRVISGEVKIV